MNRVMSRVSSKVAPKVGQWAALAGVALVLSAGLVMRGGAAPEPVLQPAASAVPEAREADSAPSLVHERRALEAELPKYLDTAETLAEYWGKDWPDVEAELFPGGVDPEELSRIQPWPEVADVHLATMDPTGDMRVEALYRQLLAWPGWEYRGTYADRPEPKMAELTPDSLFWATRCPGSSDLGQAQVEQLEGEFRELNSELDGLVRAYLDGLAAAVRFEFERGGYERAPLRFRDSAERSDDELYSRKVTAGGWTTRMQLCASQYPGLGLLKAQIDSLRQTRQERLKQRVSALRQQQEPAS